MENAIARKLVILLSIALLSQPVLGSKKKFHPSGSAEIDKVRKEIVEHPTDASNYLLRRDLLYDWLGALQQQGADVRSFYDIDVLYYKIEPRLVQSNGEELIKIQKEMCTLIDTGFNELENIQTNLIEKGTFFKPYLSGAEGFPNTGNMDAEWPMFQADEHHSGCTDAPGPKYGREKWRSPVGLGWYARPAVEGDRVYVASPGLHYTSFCFDLNTGDEIWNSTQEHPLFGIYKYPAIASTPIIINDKIVLREINSHGGNTGQAKNLVLIDKKTGQTLSRTYAGHVDYRTQYAAVSTNGKYVVYPFGVHDIYGYPAICQNFNRLICADKDNTHPLWDFNVGDIDALAEPVLNENMVFQGTTEGYVYALYLEGDRGDSRVAWSFKTDGAVNSSVALNNGRVYVGSNGGSVYCIDGKTGEQVWETKVKEVEKGTRKHFTTPTVYNDRIYVGAANKKFYCFNLINGKIIWEYEVDDWIRSRPVVTPKGIMVASIDGKLYCIDETGKLKWKKTVCTHPIYADLVFSGDKILITNSNLSLYVLDLDGKEIWQKNILKAFINDKGERIFIDQLSGGTYYQSKPTAVKGKIYYGSPAGFLFAVDAETGKEIWKFEMGAAISVGPAIQDGKVYAGQQGGERFFYCLDAETGELVWKQTVPGGWVWGSATVDDGMVYIPTVSGYAVCMNGKTGHIIWMYPTAKSIPAEPAINGDLVYFGSWNGSLYAFDKKTGEIVWKDTGIGLDSGTLIAKDEKIYVPHHQNIFMTINAKNGKIINAGNKNKEEKGNYSNFNASAALADGRAFFTARVGIGLRGIPVSSKVYCVDTETAKVLWTFPDGGGLSAPALANGRLYIASGNSPFFYCLDQKTGKPYWIHKLGNRVEEATLCIYRDKVYVLAADGYIHAIE